MSLPLATLWQRVEHGAATKQEKIDAITESGEAGAIEHRGSIAALLSDPDPEVRWYAIQVLVLDLKQRSEREEQICWSLVQNDPDEEVRFASLNCLGSLIFDRRDSATFRRLRALLSETSSALVRQGAYNALLQLAGCGPDEWLGISGTRDLPEEEDLDWGKLDAIEADICAEGR